MKKHITQNLITSTIGLTIIAALIVSSVLLAKGVIAAEGFASIVAATTAGAAGLGFVFSKDFNK